MLRNKKKRLHSNRMRVKAKVKKDGTKRIYSKLVQRGPSIKKKRRSPSLICHHNKQHRYKNHQYHAVAAALLSYVEIERDNT